MIEFTKPIRCRNGAEAKVFTTHGLSNPPYPVVGEFFSKELKCWLSANWSLQGKLEGFECDYDLVNYEPERYVYINFYKNGGGAASFASREDADSSHEEYRIRFPDRISCQKIKVEPGRFDD